MHQEAEILAQAIQSLKQESNLFKEYLFPPILNGVKYLESGG